MGIFSDIRESFASYRERIVKRGGTEATSLFFRTSRIQMAASFISATSSRLSVSFRVYFGLTEV